MKMAALKALQQMMSVYTKMDLPRCIHNFFCFSIMIYVISDGILSVIYVRLGIFVLCLY